MISQNRYRGVAALDAMLSLLPVVLIVVLALDASAYIAGAAAEASRRQQLFDRLVSAADYTIKIGAARHSGETRYPNWLDESMLSPEYAESLRKREGLSSLYIGAKEPEERYPMCIFRLYVSGELREMRKLHVCGG